MLANHIKRTKFVIGRIGRTSVYELRVQSIQPCVFVKLFVGLVTESMTTAKFVVHTFDLGISTCIGYRLDGGIERGLT